MTDVRLELPFPPKELSPNDRSGWRKKAKVVADYREDCGWHGKLWQALHEGRMPLTPPVRAAVTFIVPDRRKRDLDNLLAMLKPAWDGLVDAGVLAGDDSERFSVESAKVLLGDTPAQRGEPKVIVELRGG